MSVAKENWLSLLTKNELMNLKEYLYTLNSNVNWYTVIDKHMNTNNEKFIKHVKSLTWENHPSGIISETIMSETQLEPNYKCKNTYDHISELMFKIDFEKYSNKILYLSNKKYDEIIIDEEPKLENITIDENLNEDVNEQSENETKNKIESQSEGQSEGQSETQTKNETENETKNTLKTKLKSTTKIKSERSFESNFDTNNKSKLKSHFVKKLIDQPIEYSESKPKIKDEFKVDIDLNAKPKNKNVIKILKPDLEANISNFVREYYSIIMEEYETFFKTLNIKYEYIDTEENDCILLGHLTKKVEYNSTMKLDFSFPISYNLSENYNKLVMLIFDNVNCDEFDFNILNYRFLTL